MWVKSRNNSSIGESIRQMLATTIVIAVGVLGISLAIYQAQNGVVEHRRNLESTGYVYAAAVAKDLAAGNKAEIDRVFHSVSRLPQVVGVYAIDATGKVISSAGETVLLRSRVAASEASSYELLTKGLMAVDVDVVHGGETVGQLVLVGDVTMLRSQLIRLLEVTVLATLLSMPIAMIFGLRLQKRIITPINDLTRAMLRVRKTHEFKAAQIAGADGETGELVASFNSMVSEINQRDKELNMLAFTDMLTEIPNRAYFQRQLEGHDLPIGLPMGTGVFILDINKFSIINSTLGQQTGDALLRIVAQRLKAETPPDVCLARINGNGFGLIAQGVHGLASAQEFIAPFVASLYRPFDFSGQVINVTFSVGFALVSDFSSIKAPELLRRAELALVEAKKQGQGRVVGYAPKFGALAEEESDIEHHLKEAVSKGELQLHYQAVVNARDNTVSGFEALMRWKRADGKTIPPSRFIPIAEQAGLIAPMGEWALRRACLDAKDWEKNGLPVWTVSVNVSAAQLLLDGFTSKVKTILQETGLKPGYLCLELTESLFAGNSMSAVRNILAELSALGVKISLDDFGTGYSSLSYLEHLHFDKLKIDRSFVRSDTASASRKPLISGIVSIARAVGADVVAEGAETAGEVAHLSELGVEEIQGFYFARPLPVMEAVARALALNTEAAKRAALSRVS